MGIFQLKHAKLSLKLLFLVIFTSFLSDFIVTFFPNIREIVWPLFTISQFTLLALIYKTEISFIFVNKILILILLCFYSYAIIYFYYFDKTYPFFPNLRTISSLFFLLISLFYFYYIYDRLLTYNIFTFPLFWLNFSILLYFGGNLFLYTAINIFSFGELTDLYYPIHNVLNTIKNLLFALVFGINYFTSNYHNSHD